MTFSGTSEIVRSTAPEPGSFRDLPFADASSQRRRCCSNAGVGCAPRPLGLSIILAIAAELFDVKARFSPSNLEAELGNDVIGRLVRIGPGVIFALEQMVETPLDASQRQLPHLVHEGVPPASLDLAGLVEVGHMPFDRSPELVDSLTGKCLRRDELGDPTVPLLHLHRRANFAA